MMHFQRILLIDDDEEDQEIFLTAVKKVSAVVACDCLNDATEALQKLMAGEINPDVIFLDLNMPVMNGQQFLGKIKNNDDLENIPVIIFSTSSAPGTIRAMKEMGAHEFITKPGSFDQLVELLAPLIG